MLVDRGSVGNSFEDEHARLVEKMNWVVMPDFAPAASDCHVPPQASWVLISEIAP